METTACLRIAVDGNPDWDGLLAAFADAPAWNFAQAWLAVPEPGFRPGSVRLGWCGGRFCYLADLSDDLPVTSASGRNEPLWQLGDVLELFAGVHGQPAYIEYHTAPNGCILQLQWPDSKALASVREISDLARFTVCDDVASSRVRFTPHGWQVYGELPLLSLPGAPAELAGQVWDVSFGRYDSGGPDTPQILSSTSPLTRPSYHRRDEWRRVRFE